jgi:hypothetical protein
MTICVGEAANFSYSRLELYSVSCWMFYLTCLIGPVFQKIRCGGAILDSKARTPH